MSDVEQRPYAPKGQSLTRGAYLLVHGAGAPPQQDRPLHAAEGATAYGAQNGMRAEQVRQGYDRAASQLDPNDAAGRDALKRQVRKATPAPQLALIESLRPGTGPRPGSVGGAARTNAAWTGAAKYMGRAGRMLRGASLLLDGWDIAHARDKLRAAAGAVGSNAGGISGGIAGAELGAELGLLGGPFAEVTVPAGALVGGLVGSTAGGLGGHRVGTRLYDKARGRHAD
jgi:hypothetical protein